MALIPGTNYDVFVTTGQTINCGFTSDPNNPPPPVPGDFNLEVVVNATGTGSFSTAPGYQGLAILSTDMHTLTLLHGDYGVVNNAGSDAIILGDGNESVGGASSDTITGGTGIDQFIDGSKGRQSIVGGSAGNETIWGGGPNSFTFLIRSSAVAVTKRSEPFDLQSLAAAAMNLSMQHAGATVLRSVLRETRRSGLAVVSL
jgi:Ca2+-binding RTX toxin-like protein